MLIATNLSYSDMENKTISFIHQVLPMKTKNSKVDASLFRNIKSRASVPLCVGKAINLKVERMALNSAFCEPELILRVSIFQTITQRVLPVFSYFLNF